METKQNLNKVNLLSSDNNLRNRFNFKKLKLFVIYHKTLTIVCTVIVVLLFLSLIVYIWLPFGLVVINCDTFDSKIFIDSQDSFTYKQNRRFFLKSGVHTISVKKEGYLEYSQFFYVARFKKTNLDIILSQAFYASYLEGDINTFAPVSVDQNKSLVYFSAATGGFYRVNTDERTYQAPNNNGEVFGPNISIGEEDTVSFVRFSPDTSKVYICISSPDLSNKILLVDLKTNEIISLASEIIDIDWISDNNSVLISNNMIYTSDLRGNDKVPKETLNEFDSTNIRGFGDNKNYLAIKSIGGEEYIYIGDSNSSKEIFHYYGLTTNMILSSNRDKYLITLSGLTGNSYVVVNNIGAVQTLDVPPETSHASWLEDGEKMVICQFDQKSNNYKIGILTIGDKNLKEFMKFPYDLLNGEIEELFSIGKIVYVVTDHQIIGFNLP